MDQNQKNEVLRVTKDLNDATPIVAMTDPENGDGAYTGMTLRQLRDLLRQTEYRQAGMFDHSWAQTVQNIGICVVFVGGLILYRWSL